MRSCVGEEQPDKSVFRQTGKLFQGQADMELIKDDNLGRPEMRTGRSQHICLTNLKLNQLKTFYAANTTLVTGPVCHQKGLDQVEG